MKTEKEKDCYYCAYSYTEDIWFDTYCALTREYLNELDTEEKAKKCKHYKKFKSLRK